MSRFLRTTVRTADSDFFGFGMETASRFYAGAEEMTIVVLFKLRSLTLNGPLQLFIDNDDPAPAAQGFLVELFSAAGVTSAFFGVGDGGGSILFAESRAFTAADVDKVHRLVCVSSVTEGEMVVYLNGDAGTPVAISAYAPPTNPASQGIIGTDLGFSVTDAEVLEIAAVNQALTAAQVAELDAEILSYGKLPHIAQPWEIHLIAERLVGHSQVWDIGGLNAGRAALNEEGAGPVLSSVLIDEDTWGGDGT